MNTKNMSSVKGIDISKITRYFLYLVTTCYVLFQGPIIENDSASYIHLSMICTPGYPFFLYIFKKTFVVYFYEIVVVVQLMISLFSVYYFARFLKVTFSCNTYLSLLLDSILLLPLLIPNLLIANKITSEALAYPLFLWIILFFINFFIKADKRSFWYGLVALVLGLLVRTQFFFILPPIVLIILYKIWQTKKIRELGIILVMIFMIPVIFSFVDKMFHYAVSDRFENTSNTGVQIISIPFFVSSRDDYKIFDDKEVQDYFKHLFDHAIEKEMLDDFYIPIYGDNVYHYLHDNYANLSYEVLSVKGREFLKPSDPKGVDAVIENNKLLISMTIPLVIQNFNKCVDLFLKNLIHAFGGVHMFVFHVLLLLYSSVWWLNRKEKLAFFTMFFMLLIFSNIVLVCLVEHSLDRYMMYHQWFIPVLFVLLIDKVIKNKPVIKV